MLENLAAVWQHVHDGKLKKKPKTFIQNKKNVTFKVPVFFKKKHVRQHFRESDGNQNENSRLLL